MDFRELSETADPQKASRRCVRCGRPSERTEVEVSDNAQQKDYISSVTTQSKHSCSLLNITTKRDGSKETTSPTKSNILTPGAA